MRGVICGTIDHRTEPLNRKKCLALYEEIKKNRRNTRFDDLYSLCLCAGMYLARQQGTSHMLFLHKDNPQILVNLQKAHGGMSKPYQVAQVLEKIEAHGLMEGDD